MATFKKIVRLDITMDLLPGRMERQKVGGARSESVRAKCHTCQRCAAHDRRYEACLVSLSPPIPALIGSDSHDVIQTHKCEAKT